MSNAEKIQLVMNTLETLTLTGAYENMNKMMGIYATLAEVRDALKADENTAEVEADG